MADLPHHPEADRLSGVVGAGGAEHYHAALEGDAEDLLAVLVEVLSPRAAAAVANQVVEQRRLGCGGAEELTAARILDLLREREGLRRTLDVLHSANIASETTDDEDSFRLDHPIDYDSNPTHDPPHRQPSHGSPLSEYQTTNTTRYTGRGPSPILSAQHPPRHSPGGGSNPQSPPRRLFDETTTGWDGGSHPASPGEGAGGGAALSPSPPYLPSPPSPLRNTAGGAGGGGGGGGVARVAAAAAADLEAEADVEEQELPPPLPASRPGWRGGGGASSHPGGAGGSPDGGGGGGVAAASQLSRDVMREGEAVRVLLSHVRGGLTRCLEGSAPMLDLRQIQQQPRQATSTATTTPPSRSGTHRSGISCAPTSEVAAPAEATGGAAPHPPHPPEERIAITHGEDGWVAAPVGGGVSGVPLDPQLAPPSGARVTSSRDGFVLTLINKLREERGAAAAAEEAAAAAREECAALQGRVDALSAERGAADASRASLLKQLDEAREEISTWRDELDASLGKTRSTEAQLLTSQARQAEAVEAVRLAETGCADTLHAEKIRATEALRSAEERHQAALLSVERLAAENLACAERQHAEAMRAAEVSHEEELRCALSQAEARRRDELSHTSAATHHLEAQCNALQAELREKGRANAALTSEVDGLRDDLGSHREMGAAVERLRMENQNLLMIVSGMDHQMESAGSSVALPNPPVSPAEGRGSEVSSSRRGVGLPVTPDRGGPCGTPPAAPQVSPGLRPGFARADSVGSIASQSLSLLLERREELITSLRKERTDLESQLRSVGTTAPASPSSVVQGDELRSLRQERESLRRRADRLASKRDDDKSRMADLARQVQRLTSDRQGLVDQVSAASREVREAEAARSDWQQRCEVLSEQLRESRAASARQADDRDEACRLAKREASALQAEVKRLQADKRGAATRAAAEESRSTALLERLKEAETRADGLADELHRMEAEMAVRSTPNAALQAEHARLQAAVGQLEEEGARLKVDKARAAHAVDHERTQLLAQLSEQHSVVDGLREENSRLRAEAVLSPAKQSPVSACTPGDSEVGSNVVLMDLVERSGELEAALSAARRELSDERVARIKEEGQHRSDMARLREENERLQMRCDQADRADPGPSAEAMAAVYALAQGETSIRSRITEQESSAFQPLLMQALLHHSRTLLVRPRSGHSARSNASRGWG